MNMSIIHCNQSDRGGLYSFRTIGRLVNQPSINHFEPPSTSNYPPFRTPTSTSLTVAGSGFRTIGRLVNQPSMNHFEPPSTSNHPPFRTAFHFKPPSTSNTHINQSDRGGLWLQDNRQAGQSTFDQPL
ncbi:hypothetical protein ACN42_g6580 [Penicillium freii]|uniref:Uncharacterized protein n=1 Tax=Penicillium freii TaxID=48697 RepID=A0A101MHL1_PENFR|nr:hypothetical protein ACN42_g6580 [Penicillium freii]